MLAGIWSVASNLAIFVSPTIWANCRASGLRVDVGQREEVEVGYRLKVRVRAREKAGDERCLVVHVALRGAVEHVRAAVDNAGGLHQLSPAVHVAVLWTEDGAPGLKRSLD